MGSATNAATLLSSVTLGITVFGERLHQGGGRLVIVVVALGVVLVGALLLARAPLPEPTARRTTVSPR